MKPRVIVFLFSTLILIIFSCKKENVPKESIDPCANGIINTSLDSTLKIGNDFARLDNFHANIQSYCKVKWFQEGDNWKIHLHGVNQNATEITELIVYLPGPNLPTQPGNYTILPSDSLLNSGEASIYFKSTIIDFDQYAQPSPTTTSTVVEVHSVAGQLHVLCDQGNLRIQFDNVECIDSENTPHLLSGDITCYKD